MFQCEGPSCRGAWTSFLNGGCINHKFRDGWNVESGPAARASGKIPEKKPKPRSNLATAAEMWNSANPNHTDNKKTNDKRNKNTDDKKGKGG